MKNLAFIGDIAFNGLLSCEPEKNNERISFVSPLLKEMDMVFANLEVPVRGKDEYNEYKKLVHYSLPEPTSRLLNSLNIGCVSLANNHIYDCKMSGVKASIELLDKLGIHHTGAGWLKEHCEPVIINTPQQKIGFIAYVDNSTNPHVKYFPELFINVLELEVVKQDILLLKQKVDLIICSIHWGTDYSYYPTSNQLEQARKLVDCGADIIAGHHPHTIQPFEIYKSGRIFYSLGGLMFGDFIKDGKMIALYRKTKKGLIVTFNVERNGLEFVTTTEKIGNYIKLSDSNFERWSAKKWRFYSLREKYRLFKFVNIIQEKIVDRIYEYFFGYYQRPLLRLFQFSNLKKIKRLLKS